MLRAVAVKAVAIAAIVAIAMLAPAAWRWPGIIVILVATVGFLTYAIWHPHSGFFAPIVDRIHGRALGGDIALTFDDGPDPVFTPQILDVLAAHGARATFFVLGCRAAEHPDVIRRIVAEGHALGTHTQTHPIAFHFSSPAGVAAEISAGVASVAAVVPETRLTLFRPPQGLRTPLFGSAWKSFARKGFVCVTWSVKALDSFATTADKIVARVTPHLGPGAIVAMHDGTGLGGGHDRAPTIAALDRLLATCEARGLRCIALDPTA
ncbi:MAG TPA: polysaccharide deacetylase family protein [Kofleriaceae bacterium]